ncbi:MAG TPA: hypothetical protein VJS65_02150, partial [Verrucomicrobiae bacterium]|nr:hypothetical protein [Verrucomicrobiae bacterium]
PKPRAKAGPRRVPAARTFRSPTGGSSYVPKVSVWLPSAGTRTGLAAGYVFSVLLTFRSFVGNFVENLAEFDGLFSNINRVDEVPDEVSDKVSDVGQQRLTR